MTLLISGGTVVCSLLSARLINRFGTAKVTAVSTAVTAAALLGFSLAPNLLWLCVFAVPLGLGAGAIDTALNNYVALHYKALHMNFLHCFYGVGVSISPYLMSLALSGSGGWRGGYRMVFWLQLGITLLTALSLPVWKKVRFSAAGEDAPPPRTVGMSELLKRADIRAACLVFIGSCAVECTCGSWGSTFLVNAKGMAADRAAAVITFYYVGLALGRFLSGVFSGRLTSRQLIRVGQGILLAALVLLLLPLPPAVSGGALFLIGLGNGPVFPNMIHQTPRNFGQDISQSAMGMQMAAAYVGILLAPPLFGLLAQAVDAALFPCYLLVFYLIMLSDSWLLEHRRTRRQERPREG